MLDTDLKELYVLLEEQQNIKNELKELKSDLFDINDTVNELKNKIIDGLNHIDHKYAKYKNMHLTLCNKPKKIKLDKNDLSSFIEEIIVNDNVSATEKRDKILKALKPQETGIFEDVLKIKIL